MIITDVPESGKYFQQGAIVRLVVQLIDIETGLPIPLQTATGLTISILYPDLETSQTFPATLYTDGSDGQISYITQNDGTTIDLTQTGLYRMQGDAIIGGVSLPPSYETDFYVLPNVFGGPSVTNTTPTAIILFDSTGVRWVGTVSAGGVISWAAQISGPASYLYVNSLVMKDDLGVYWTISISTLGVISAVPGGTFPHALNYFFLADINGKSWLVTISEDGILVPS